MIQVKINDQLGAQPALNVHVLEWKNGVECTLTQLISERVKLEYEEVFQNRDSVEYANHLVHFPANATCSIDEAVGAAIAGIQNNAFFVIVDEEQISDLDCEFLLNSNSEITFVKLLPLQGG